MRYACVETGYLKGFNSLTWKNDFCAESVEDSDATNQLMAKNSSNGEKWKTDEMT